MGQAALVANMAKCAMIICYCHLVGGNMAILHHHNQTHSWNGSISDYDIRISRYFVILGKTIIQTNNILIFSLNH